MLAIEKLRVAFELTNCSIKDVLENDVEALLIKMYLKAKKEVGYNNFYSLNGGDIILSLEKKDDFRDILILQNTVAFFDRSNYAVEITYDNDEGFKVTYALSLYDDEEKTSYSIWGDYRDYVKVSVKTLIDHDFDMRKVGYGDNRDPHFMYEKGFFTKGVANKPSEFSHGFKDNLFYFINELQYVEDYLGHPEIYSIEIFEKSDNFWG